MMQAVKQLFGQVRGVVASAIVRGITDTGAAQTATLQTHDVAVRANVEVYQAFGFSSVAPANGAYSLVFAVGNDVSNLVALPPANPYARMGGLLAGESAMYGADGTRVRIRQGGAVEIWAKHVTIYSNDTTIDAPNGVTINGNVQVNGNLTTTGNLADSHGSLDRLRGHYDSHTHVSSTSGTPTSTTSAVDSE